MIKSEILKFSHAIAGEHYELTKNTDNNLNYLWYLYFQGSKQGFYKPFIFYAEIQLLYYLEVITKEEKEGLEKIIDTPHNSDDFYIGYLALKEFRKERHKKFGANMNAPAYDAVKADYCFVILNHELFIKHIK